MRVRPVTPAWQRHVTRHGHAAVAAFLVLLQTLRYAVGTPLVWGRSIAAQPANEYLGIAPRAVPHCLVLSAVAIAIFSGGFARPDTGVAALMGLGSEEGDLSANGRFVLGPRAAEVQVRDSLIRPALPSTEAALSGPRAPVVTYQVQPGDTIWDIGLRFNVGPYSVMWSNGLEESAIIKPGQELRIPPVAGTLHTVVADDNLDAIARKYNVDPAVIVDFNGLRPGEGLPVSRLLVIPGGQLPIVRRQPVVPQVQVPQVQAPRVQPVPPLPQPVRPQIPVPAPPPTGATGRFVWPARGVITTYFQWWHPGIDIAAPVGTPIAAADGGTVTFTGWDNTGYGYRIVINHGNGFSSTYNHLASIGVRTGQGVGRGQVIGGMGSTGRSSGPHLHFEILRNGSFVNPIGVLG